MRKKKSTNDKCVCCGCDTGVPAETPISQRQYYICGSGQLCSKCFAELYIDPLFDEDQMSNEDLYRLLKLCEEKKV